MQRGLAKGFSVAALRVASSDGSTGGDGSPLDLDGADSDGARIAQATGLFMERFGLDALQALALLQVVSSMKFLGAASFARELVEEWPLSA